MPDTLHADETVHEVIQPNDTLSAAIPGLATHCEQPGCINVYFNKSALTQFALPNNVANHSMNLEERLLHRLNSATASIDLATYEINLPDVVDALIERAAAGLNVRVLADAKNGSAADPAHVERYERMRLHLERLVRGQDGVPGTHDDVSVFADSPIFAVEDASVRSQFGLPASPVDFDPVTIEVGASQESGRLLADGELKAVGEYFAPGNQMHNKFALVDSMWVFTGSWNVTVTGLYGTEANRLAGVLGGNQQHVVELHSPDLAAIYTTEFDEMWGGASWEPNPANANFHGRKRDNTLHTLTVGGRTVEVFFSPGDDALGRLRELLEQEADEHVYFTIFAWSDQGLVDAMKLKWEDSDQDEVGTLTGFDVRGVFDSGFSNAWWSASVDMTGRTGSSSSTNKPNTRWANAPPVFRDAETRKLHSKTMLIDADTSSDPTVVIGSTNWSKNGNDVNDENMVIIHDELIANQFLQEFYARYRAAGGQVP